MAAVCALGSCSRMMPLRATLQPLGEQFQLLRRRHRIPVAGPEIGAEHGDAARLQRCPASPASFRRRESERTACSGSWWPFREAPFRPPRCPCRSRRSPRPASCISDCDGSRCDAPTVWPSAAIRRTSSGCSEAGLPIRKKVARTHSLRQRRQHLRRSSRGHGPSSKVSTTSWSSSGSVCGKLLRPTRGVVAASTARTREVPSASLRGHSAACAAATKRHRVPRPPSTAPR